MQNQPNNISHPPIAHSGSRSGISDYNDGDYVTHYTGIEENRIKIKNENEVIDFDGSEALGNELTEENLEKKENADLD